MLNEKEVKELKTFFENNPDVYDENDRLPGG